MDDGMDTLRLTRRSLLLGAALAPGVLPGQDESGFTSLFDGETLKGWTIENGPESAFYVDAGAIAVHRGANYPTWLRSERQYENFDFRGEFFLQGWMDSGIFLRAPEHGRPTSCGIEINLFHQPEDQPGPYSCGAIFPLVAPRAVNVKNKGEWNSFRILADWPRLQAWINGTLIQDIDLSTHAELRYRLRRGYLGFESLSYPIRFRNLRIRELPARDTWTPLYEGPSDLARWTLSEGQPVVQALGKVLRVEGYGHYRTEARYRDFALQCYIRTSRWHNGGILFRSAGRGLKTGQYYEIQLHNVEGAHYPTGSLYHHRRAVYPRIEDERWWLFQMWVQGREALVRIDGQNVMEYAGLANLEPGHIELQAHQNGTWMELKHILVKTL
jgi:hypothetical protein